MNAGPSIEDAETRAKEIERLIILVEDEARKSDLRRTRWVTAREIGSIAGALRFSLRYLMQAIRKAREGVIVCSSCERETLELARSRNLTGARCVSCAVPALDGMIAVLIAELEPYRSAPIEQPQQLGEQCQPRRKRPSARRSARG